MNKIYNPKEAICIIVYTTPRNAEEIKDKMYGKRNSKLPKLLKELREENKITSVLSPDNRYHIFQTRPETLLNYIIKELKIKDISLDNNEKNQVLKYLKSEEFKKQINLMVSNLNIRSEHFTFKGLIEDLSLRCIYEHNRHQFLKAKKFPLDKLPDDFSLLKMDYKLLAKLLSLYYNAYVINKHYENFIVMINGVYQITNTKKYDDKKENNHFRG